MTKEQAVQNLTNLLNLEVKREAVTASEAVAFQDAITNGKVDALKKMYTGPDAKSTLSLHDKKSLLESCEVISGGEKKASGAKKAAKTA